MVVPILAIGVLTMGASVALCLAVARYTSYPRPLIPIFLPLPCMAGVVAMLLVWTHG